MDSIDTNVPRSSASDELFKEQRKQLAQTNPAEYIRLRNEMVKAVSESYITKVGGAVTAAEGTITPELLKLWYEMTQEKVEKEYPLDFLLNPSPNNVRSP